MTLLSRSSGSFPERHNKGIIQASLSICHVLNMNLTAKFSLMEKAYMGVYKYICVFDQIPDQQLWSLTIYSRASLSSWLIIWPLWCRRTHISVVSLSADCIAINKVILLQTSTCLIYLRVFFLIYFENFFAALPVFFFISVAGSPAFSWMLVVRARGGADQKWKTSDFMRKSIMWPEEAWLTGQLDESSLKIANALIWA